VKLNLYVFAVFIATAVLQAAAGDLLSIYGVKPSLMLIALYAFAITESAWAGILYGAFAGFLDDCLSGGYIGLFVSEYAIIGYLASRAGKKWFNIGESSNFGGIFTASLLGGIYTAALVSTVRGGQDTLYLALRFGLPQAAYNAFAGVFILWLFKELLARRVPWLQKVRQLQVRL